MGFVSSITHTPILRSREDRMEGAGLGIHGPSTTGARIRDQDVDPTSLLDDPRHHCPDRPVVTDIDLDLQRDPARRLDFGNVAVGGPVVRLASNSSSEC